jgi:hypothetical protein
LEVEIGCRKRDLAELPIGDDCDPAALRRVPVELAGFPVVRLPAPLCDELRAIENAP